MSASMIAGALGQISLDLGADKTTMQIVFSIFILGLGFAPFPIAALSETYGRKPVWLVCSVCYIFWNAMCPVGKSLPVMVVGRFFSGSGASVGVTVCRVFTSPSLQSFLVHGSFLTDPSFSLSQLTGPIMADMYRKEHRGKSLAIATFVPYLGPALGPVIGGLISQKLTWPWLFWILSIFDAIITLTTLLLVPETYTPVLLRRKTSARVDTNLELSSNPLEKSLRQDFYRRLSTNLLRPLKLLVHRPIIQVISLIMALNFGVYCLLLSTFASLWIDKYGQSELIASLHYIAISIGTTIATQAGGRSMDYIFRKLKAQSKDGSTPPEFRVPFIVPGVIMIPIGLFWYGWAAETGMHWAMVDCGVSIFVCGSFVLAQGMLAYLLDEFQHAASASAASRLLMYNLGFAFPIFAPEMYSRLGYGWGNSVLGFVFIGLGVPVPLLLWRWGAKLRSLGREKTF